MADRNRKMLVAKLASRTYAGIKLCRWWKRIKIWKLLMAHPKAMFTLAYCIRYIWARFKLRKMRAGALLLAKFLKDAYDKAFLMKRLYGFRKAIIKLQKYVRGWIRIQQARVYLLYLAMERIELRREKVAKEAYFKSLQSSVKAMSKMEGFSDTVIQINTVQKKIHKLLDEEDKAIKKILRQQQHAAFEEDSSVSSTPPAKTNVHAQGGAGHGHGHGHHAPGHAQGPHAHHPHPHTHGHGAQHGHGHESSNTHAHGHGHGHPHGHGPHGHGHGHGHSHHAHSHSLHDEPKVLLPSAIAESSSLLSGSMSEQGSTTIGDDDDDDDEDDNDTFKKKRQAKKLQRQQQKQQQQQSHQQLQTLRGQHDSDTQHSHTHSFNNSNNANNNKSNPHMNAATTRNMKQHKGPTSHPDTTNTTQSQKQQQQQQQAANKSTKSTGTRIALDSVPDLPVTWKYVHKTAFIKKMMATSKDSRHKLAILYDVLKRQRKRHMLHIDEANLRTKKTGNTVKVNKQGLQKFLKNPYNNVEGIDLVFNGLNGELAHLSRVQRANECLFLLLKKGGLDYLESISSSVYNLPPEQQL